MQSGWVGFDLDGTLAEYHGWNEGAIGHPIPSMVGLVKGYLNQGVEVRIMTARVAQSGAQNDQGVWDTQTFASDQRAMIEEWCQIHIGQILPVTAQKDFRMTLLYDDRAVGVETNTGRIIQ